MVAGPRRLVMVLLLVLLAGACGTNDDTATDTPSSGPAEPTSTATSAPATDATPTQAPTPAGPSIPAGTPECSNVWDPSKRLPGDYRGCAADEKLVKPITLGCSSGQTIVVYAYHYWAVRGGTIRQARKLVKDPRYVRDVQRCRG